MLCHAVYYNVFHGLIFGYILYGVAITALCYIMLPCMLYFIEWGISFIRTGCVWLDEVTPHLLDCVT